MAEKPSRKPSRVPGKPNPAVQSSLQQRTSKENVDKESGSYNGSIVRECVTTGESFKDRDSRRVGFKDEYKITSTYKIGDKNGYTEYQVEERFRRVNFAKNNHHHKGNTSLAPVVNKHLN